MRGFPQVPAYLLASRYNEDMSYTDAQNQAKQNSTQYATIMYVIELKEGKRYAVISEARYNSRGLEAKVMCIYANGQLIG
jgi:hypothetical protein